LSGLKVHVEIFWTLVTIRKKLERNKTGCICILVGENWWLCLFTFLSYNNRRQFRRWVIL